MIGRGLQEGKRGEDVLRNTVDFIISVIDSARIGSNISVVTFSDRVNNLTWREVNEFKKEDFNFFWDMVHPKKMMKYIKSEMNGEVKDKK